MTAPDEKALVRLAQKGDEGATSALIRAYQERLYRFCLYLCNDPSLAQDLCQDAFIKALASIRSLRDPGGFQSWILKTAKNLYLDHVKSPRNRGHQDMDDTANPAVAEAVRQDPKTDTVLQVQAALAQLPPQDRMLLVLIDMEGHSYAEAGEAIGISESNVRFRLHHIRKAFLQFYNQ